MFSKSPSQNEQKKSVVFIPSRLGPSKINDIGSGEETEIAAEITVPPEGGWGWVVVAASFYNIFIIDGILFTFGSLYSDITEDLEVEGALVALLNSIAASLLFLLGPLVSALINRFGFRAINMTGSMIVSFGFLCAYFCSTYIGILIFYSIVAGVGACLSYLPSAIIAGFYFERLRSIALALTGMGSSVGIMIMFSVNSFLVSIAGWRITMLIHSGLMGTIFFSSMTFRPLLSMTVTKTTDEPTRTVTYLPSLSKVAVGRPDGTSSGTRNQGIANVTERLFRAVSNAHFPTAATVLEERAQATTTQAGSSAPNVSRLTIIANSPDGGISQRQLKQVQSLVSRASTMNTNKDTYVELKVEVRQPTEIQPKKRWWARLCGWEKHVPESRPMYRDDAFYAGKVENLPAYQKSVMETPPEARTGLEYSMAVTRAVRATDLEERHGVCTTAIRRILATMLDPRLLKRCSFLLMCSSGFFVYIGLLIPYVFLPERTKKEGIEAHHCTLFVSVIGFSNTIGRILSGVLPYKFDVLTLYQISTILSGIGTMAYNFSLNVYYQYFCCVFFGIFIAMVSALRSLVIVLLYGLDKLTNATGMVIMCQGIACLISTPLSNIIKENFGYSVSFYVAGAFIVFGGVILFPVRKLAEKEDKKESEADASKT